MLYCPTCKSNSYLFMYKNINEVRDGIDVTLIETPVFICTSCERMIIPQKVESLIEVYLREKQRDKDTFPYLYIHVKELLND